MFTRERLTRWTDALRARPEKQYREGGLANADFTQTCCLGELCEVEGLERDTRNGGYSQAGESGYRVLVQRWPLAQEFGSVRGAFMTLNMPDLRYAGQRYTAAVSANDHGVPWPVIADHFDRYYPCSDTGPKERAE